MKLRTVRWWSDTDIHEIGDFSLVRTFVRLRTVQWIVDIHEN